jgi:dimethylargininase
LHLKTACAALPDGRLLVNRGWLDTRDLAEFELVPVDEREPFAANALCVGQRVVMSAAHQRTAAAVRRMGHEVETVDISEFAKAEGGVTCLSLLFRACPTREGEAPAEP